MLEFTKTILKKVSFNEFLFEKELNKAKKWLASDELELLEMWCRNEFPHYEELVSETFQKQAV